NFFGERLEVDVTYFEADLQDEIQTTYLPTFESTPVNLSGRSKRRGIEVTAKARVTEDLDLSGSFTWLDAKEPTGRTEVRRPKYLASATANYRLLDGRGNINISADYNGR